MLIRSTHHKNAPSHSSSLRESRLLYIDFANTNQLEVGGLENHESTRGRNLPEESTRKRMQALFTDAEIPEDNNGTTGSVQKVDLPALLSKATYLAGLAKQAQQESSNIPKLIDQLPESDDTKTEVHQYWSAVNDSAQYAEHDLEWLKGIISGLTKWEASTMSAGGLAAVLDAGTNGSAPPELQKRADRVLKKYSEHALTPLAEIQDSAVQNEIRQAMNEAVDFDTLAFNLQHRVFDHETTIANSAAIAQRLQTQLDPNTRDQVGTLFADQGETEGQPNGVHTIPDGTFPINESADEDEEGESTEDNEIKVDKTEPAQKIVDDIRSLKSGIQAIKKEQFAVISMVKSQFTDRKTRNEMIGKWEDNIKVISDAEGELLWLEGFMSHFAQWEDGKLSPADFANAVKGGLNGTDVAKAINGTLDSTLLSQGVYAGAALATIPQNAKEDVKKAMEDAINYAELKGYVSKNIGLYNNVINSCNEFADELKLNQKKQDAQGGRSRSLFGVEFYSINNYINMAKLIGEGLKSGWEKRQRRKEATGAQSIARALSFVPYGKEMNINLDQKVDSANEDEKNDFKKTLDDISFDQVSDLLSKNSTNPNHFLGILEAAASHGWLYDLDLESATVFGRQIIFPDTWNITRQGNYIANLDTQNRRGENDERQRGQDRVGSLESIPPIVKVLKMELKDKNYWAAIGILKTMIDKAKSGYTIEWFTTTFISHLRADPMARKIIGPAVDNLMDQAGNMTLAHLAGLTVNNIKFQRDKFARIMYSDNFESDGRRGTGGIVIQNVLKIEDEIVQKLGRRPNQDDLDILVARVLASQTVKLENGSVVSLYDEQFNGLRQQVLEAPMNPDIKSIDDDYFAEESGAVLVNNEAFREVFSLNSGSLTYGTKPLMLSERIFKKQDDLEALVKNPPQGQSKDRYTKMLANYNKEMKRRFNNLITQTANDGRAGKFALAERLGNLPDDKKYLLVELVKRNLLDKSEVMKVTSFTGGKDFGQGLLKLLLEQQQVSREDLAMMKDMVTKGQADKSTFETLVNNAKTQGVINDAEKRFLLPDKPKPKSGSGTSSASSPYTQVA